MLCTALCGGIDEYSLSQTDGASLYESSGHYNCLGEGGSLV